MISTELTKNTTRVVEAAVRGEVQNSVLPSLENITKSEVKNAITYQITKGLGDSMKQVSGLESPTCNVRLILDCAQRLFLRKSRSCLSSLKCRIRSPETWSLA